jgi:hypothetical protein
MTQPDKRPESAEALDAWLSRTPEQWKAARIDAMARAICQETCAFKGEPPCWAVPDLDSFIRWPPPTCDEPGCVALATAAHFASIPGKV